MRVFICILALLLLTSIVFPSCTGENHQDIRELRNRVLKDPSDKTDLAKIKNEMGSFYSLNRTNAAGALAIIGTVHKELGPDMLDVLIKGLSDHDQSVRRESASAMQSIAQPETARAIPYLTKCLKEGDNDVAWFAAMALGNFGALAKSAVPTLIKTLDTFSDQSSFNLISEKSADALGDIGDSNAKPALVRAARSANERTRTAAEKALAKLSHGK